MTSHKNEATTQLDWLQRTNLVYGVVGLLIISQVGANGAWKSFVVGWTVSVINLELLKRFCAMILAIFQNERVGPSFYVLLTGKFAFWGVVMALFSLVSWIQAIPFILGSVTLLIAGIALGMREMVYARAA